MAAPSVARPLAEGPQVPLGRARELSKWSVAARLVVTMGRVVVAWWWLTAPTVFALLVGGPLLAGFVGVVAGLVVGWRARLWVTGSLVGSVAAVVWWAWPWLAMRAGVSAAVAGRSRVPRLVALDWDHGGGWGWPSWWRTTLKPVACKTLRVSV